MVIQDKGPVAMAGAKNYGKNSSVPFIKQAANKRDNGIYCSTRIPTTVVSTAKLRDHRGAQEAGKLYKEYEPRATEEKFSNPGD